MSSNNTFVASYATEHLARDSVRHLQDEGFDAQKLFIIARDEGSTDFDFAGARCLSHLNQLGATLHNCIPAGDAADFDAELQAGRVVLVAHGTAEEIEHAKCIRDKNPMQSWDSGADTAVYYGCND